MNQVKLSSISAFFPAYNEEENVGLMVERLSAVLSKTANQYEILVVNDGSVDNTKKITEEIASRNPWVRLIDHPKNLGYGAAVKSGIYNSKLDYIFFIDGDNQFDPAELTSLVPYINGYDLVVGFRKHRRDPFIRILNSFGWNVLVKFLFRFWVKDVNCAFKLFKREIFEKIKLSTDSALINTELFAQVRKFGFKLKEVGVTHYPRRFGAQTGAKSRVILRAFVELFRIYFHSRSI